MILANVFYPDSFQEIGANFQNTFFIVDYALACLICILSLIFIFRFIKSKGICIFYLITLLVLLGSIAIGFYLLVIIAAILLVTITVAIMILNGNEIRSVIRDELHFSGIFSTKKNRTELTRAIELCDEIETAVIAMSHEKCGALITIERSDRITTDHFSRWTDMDAEATNELLRTIFYKGTPLHDGATIIREGRIIRSGVIFDSVSVSNKAMPGSLGSRHRAALGITENYDCFSITVSEETGSIHISVGGRIEKCFPSNLKEKLIELLKPTAISEPTIED